MTEPSLALTDSDDLENRISGVGRDLGEVLNAALDALPEGRSGPQLLGRSLGIDKVLASRLVKAARSRDPLAVTYHVPGPLVLWDLPMETITAALLLIYLWFKKKQGYLGRWGGVYLIGLYAMYLAVRVMFFSVD